MCINRACLRIIPLIRRRSIWQQTSSRCVVHLMWTEWGLHVLVLLSFTLQLTLLLAEFRRRIDSGVLRAFIWSAYTLADSVAIYTIGHLSVTSQAADHQVMALWAPLLAAGAPWRAGQHHGLRHRGQPAVAAPPACRRSPFRPLELLTSCMCP